MKTILLVDNRTHIINSIRKLFLSRHAVLTAKSAAQALQVLEHTQRTRRQPDLVMLDTDTPGIDGLKLARRITQEWQIPVVFLSCVDDPTMQGEVITAYAEDFITKPFDLKELVARIERVLAAPDLESAPSGMLTPRQVQILTLLVQGHSDQQIARRLDLKQRTVRFHIQSATRRLGARSRVHAVSIALGRGLILPGERV
jgi:DNA-binding NarL/FixJ family response regulator